MRHRLSWKSPPLGRLLAGLCLVAGCLFGALSTQAADILLTGAEDNPGVQSFVRALSDMRPADSVRFQPLTSLPAPGKLPAATRLILLDLPSLDWRQQETKGPATLVLRISRLQAQQRFGINVPSHLSLLWSDAPVDRQLRLTRIILPEAQRIGVLYDNHSEFMLKELRKAALGLTLEVVAERWANTHDSHPLQTLLKNCDVLLGLDDPDLYNSKTAKNLLLSSYSRQLALIGPNAAFVKAGSLASTYSDQSDWLQVLDELLDLPAASWPRTLYPQHLSLIHI